jgi:hypothetical protein
VGSDVSKRVQWDFFVFTITPIRNPGKHRQKYHREYPRNWREVLDSLRSQNWENPQQNRKQSDTLAIHCPSFLSCAHGFHIGKGELEADVCLPHNFGTFYRKLAWETLWILAWQADPGHLEMGVGLTMASAQILEYGLH